MSQNTYNGWTNYATWRVNLEMIDGSHWQTQINEYAGAYELGQAMKDWAEGYIIETSKEGLAQDYALTFLSEVCWYEIALSLINDYSQEAA